MLYLIPVVLAVWSGHPSGLEPIQAPVTPRVAATVKLLDQFYCGLEPTDVTGSLFLTLEVELRNGSKRPLIVSRQLGPPMVTRVARSVEEAKRSEYAAEVAWEEVYDEAHVKRIPRVRAGPMPDSSQFVVLSPGGSYATTVTASVVVSRSVSPHIPGAVREESDYLLQLDLQLWPFRLSSEAEIQDLQERWRSVGELAVEVVGSNLLPFHASSLGHLQTCNDELIGWPPK